MSMPNLQRLAKWRSVFAGWQLGTRSDQDAESNAVRDHREATLLLRVEVTALAGLLIKKGLFTTDEFLREIEREAHLLEQQLQDRFPGFKATDQGISIDPVKARATMKGWRQ